MKYLYCLIFLLLSLTTQAQQKDSEQIHWLTFEQLTDSLHQKPKKVLLFFHTDWCSYCRKMMRETFRDASVVKEINKNYYAVHFDAESTDSIYFDGNLYTHPTRKKKTGNYHPLATIFLGDKHIIFPSTIGLDENLNLFFFKQKYLSIKEFLKIL